MINTLINYTFNNIPLSNWDYVLIITVYNYPKLCYFSMKITFVKSTTFTKLSNPTLPNAMEMFGATQVGSMVVSGCIEVKSQVSILVPTI